MIKNLAIACLLGLACAEGWTEGDNLVDNDWFSLNWMVGADAGYGTHWSTSEVSGFTTEVYGGHIYTTTHAMLSGEYMKARQYSVEMEFIPIWFAPYEQYVVWSRTVSEDTFDNQFYLKVAGAYKIVSGSYTTTWVKNMKTVKVSLVDYLEDDRTELGPQDSDWTFNEDYEYDEEDTYWSGNVFENIDADLYANLNMISNYYDSWLTD